MEDLKIASSSDLSENREYISSVAVLVPVDTISVKRETTIYKSSNELRPSKVSGLIVQELRPLPNFFVHNFKVNQILQNLYFLFTLSFLK